MELLFSAEEKEHLIIGMKQSLKFLKEGKVKKLYIAEDADQFVTREVELLGKEKHVEIQRVPSMRRLGQACGIEINAAIVSVVYS